MVAVQRWTLVEVPRAAHQVLIDDVEVLAEAARFADMSIVRPHIAKAIRILRGAGNALDLDLP